jgi:phage shock protein A
MTMTLFDRIATLVKADAHGVVESLEERSLLLKQYLREAEYALDQQRVRLAAVGEHEQQLAEALAQREAELATCEEDIALALAGSKEDLARFAIRRLIPCRREAEVLRTRLAQRRAQSAALAERLRGQQAQLEALRGRVRAEVALGETRCGADWSGAAAVAEEEVDLELLRRRQGAGARP